MEDGLELLPSFDRPPLGEVAMLAQFDQIEPFRNVDYFRLWSQSELKHFYPAIGEYLELPPFFEEFDVPKSEPAEYVKRMNFRPVARYNFRSNERAEQFQVQRDRVGFYWQ